MMHEIEVDLPEIDESSGLEGFLRTLAGYYRQFLETDFKAARIPKRRFERHDRFKNRTGISLDWYDSFRDLARTKLDNKTPPDFTIRRGTHKGNLSPALTATIDSAIKAARFRSIQDRLPGLQAWLRSELSSTSPDIDVIAERAEDEILGILRADAVDPVLSLLIPVLERNQSEGGALERLLSYSDEIAQFLAGSALSMLPLAIAELDNDEVSPAFDEISEVGLSSESLREGLEEYFSNFALSDVFTDLREIYSSHALLENSQVYLNVGEIQHKNHHFPLYYIPIELETVREGIRIVFDSRVFVNKRAVDYIAGELGKVVDQTQPSPLTDRIFYKDPNDTYVEVIDQTAHKIMAALHVEGEVSFDTSGKQVGEGPGFKISNALSISLSDKSDESIVNDYEALTTGLDGGSDLIDAFEELVNGFITENPVSIEAPVSQEWVGTDVPARLVFESPLPLAEEQRKVLSAIRNPDGRFVLVEGPPGTGKSHTIAAIAFEMILRGQNILILSDKTEALDVAEDKINQVIERVRGQAEFVNPILRLGKTGSNYANITKNTTIDKLKSANEAYRANEQSFLKELNRRKELLLTGVDETLKAAQGIKVSDITRLIGRETRFYEEHPKLSKLEPEQHAALGIVSNLVELMISKRDIFDVLLDGVYSNVSMGSLMVLSSIVEEDTERFQTLAKRYPDAKSARLRNLEDVAGEIEALKRPIIGYLFRSAVLQRIADDIKDVMGVKFPKPQNQINELCTFANDGSEWLRLIRTNRIATDNADLAWRFMAMEAPLTIEDFGVIEAFLELDLVWAKDLGYPLEVKDIGDLRPGQNSWLRELADIIRGESLIAEAFASFPEFDYLQGKTLYENLAARKLAAEIDSQVISFVTQSRNDARALKKVIKDKAKFPVEDFEKLRKAFPCMIAGLRDFAEFIPLEKRLFDLVIIDEASQVSIAQALPAILRAKKMLVMGDRRQFGNVKTSHASKAINNAYFSKVKEAFNQSLGGATSSTDLARCNVLNIKSSVMDFFEMTSNYACQLRKHFRGYPEHISFSSRYFYDQSLQALKIRGCPADDIIQFIENPNPDQFQLVKNANEWEGEAIFEELEKLLELDEPPTACVITPFREQQTYLSLRLSKHPQREKLLKRLKFSVYTFDSCQGEERDVVFYSMVATRDHDHLGYIFPPDIHGAREDDLDGKLKFQRLNVGFSRVREKMVFVLSKPASEYKSSIKQVLAHYADELEGAKAMPSSEEVDPNSPMEKKLLEWLRQSNFVQGHMGDLEIVPQFELGVYLKALDSTYTHPNYKVDFLLRLTRGSGEVTQVILEYDGFQYHFDQDADVNAGNWQDYLTSSDVERQLVLESYGYKMLRVNRFTLGDDPVATLDERLTDLFEELTGSNRQGRVISEIQRQTDRDLVALNDGTGRRCGRCRKVQLNKEFYDPSLASKYGRNCRTCKHFLKRR